MTWQCSGEMGTSSWNCDQRIVSNGRVIDDEPVKTVLAGTTPESVPRNPGITGKKSLHQTGGDWKNDLPGLDGSEPDAIQNNRESIPSGDRPTPEPEFADDLSDDISDQIDVTSPQDEVVTAEQVEKGSLLPIDGYTVQLAALDSREEANRFIARHKLQDLTLKQHITRGDDRIWHVITWGHFATQEEALEGWSRQSQTHPGIKVWIRSMQSLRAVTRNADVK